MNIKAKARAGRGGFSLRDETPWLIAGTAVVKGHAYPIDVAIVGDDGISWTTTDGVAASTGDYGMYFVPQESAAAGVLVHGHVQGTIDGVAGEAFAVGAPLAINASGRFIDTLAGAGVRVHGEAREAASADGDTVKIAFYGLGAISVAT